MALGRLVLVVGPSGVGKDALIAGARAALRDNSNFVFARRIVTRPARRDLEDHHSLSTIEFERAAQRGAFSLSWQAHGLCYALPLSAATDIALGRTVVANVSRHVVREALERFPGAAVVLVRAEVRLRAERLAARRRESPEQIAARLAREGPALPESVQPIVLDNSGSLAAGLDRFVLLLSHLADPQP